MKATHEKATTYRRYVCCVRPEFSGPLLDALRKYADRGLMIVQFELSREQGISLQSIWANMDAEGVAPSFEAAARLQAFADGWRSAAYGL